jgi:hypothetical protein
LIAEPNANYCRICGRKVKSGVRKPLSFQPTRFLGSIRGGKKTKTPPRPVLAVSAQEQEAMSRFRHICDQIDVTNSETDLRALLNESEYLRRSAKEEGFSELGNVQHKIVARKVRSRAIYISFKETTKFAATTITKLVVQ